MGKIKTYNPKEVTMALWQPHCHRLRRRRPFITIDPNGDGVTKKVGCDGRSSAASARTTPTS